MSSTKKLSAEKYSVLPFFKFNLRRNLQHLALYLVIAVLAMVLPTVMIINDYSNRSLSGTVLFSVESVANDVAVIAAIGIFVSATIALLAGMSTGAYLNSKNSVGCYHSFPLKREDILGCECLTRLIYFGVTMLFGYAVPYLIMLVALPTEGVVYGAVNYWNLAAASIFVFLTIYSLLIFCAGLTGNAVTRILMAALVVCLPTALYALAVTLAGMNSADLYSSYYLNESIIRKMFVPVRGATAIMELIENGSFALLLTTLIDTAFYTVGAFILQKFRRSEVSGNSIIWKPVFVIVKLGVVVASTMFGAWFFAELMGMREILSLFIGSIIGGVLSFIVANCILYRSSRAMFKGIKSFGVTMAVMFAFMLIVPLNITGMIGRFYPAANTDELIIKLSPYGVEMTFDEADDISEIVSMLDNDSSLESSEEYPWAPSYDVKEHPIIDILDDNYKSEYANKYTYEEEEYGIYISDVYERSRSYSVTVIQKPKFGIPLAKHVSVGVKSDFMDAILATDEFDRAMNISEYIDPEDISEAEICLDNRTLYLYDGFEYISYDNFGEMDSFISKEAKDVFVDILRKTSFKAEYRESSPVVGKIVVYYGVDKLIETNVNAKRASVTVPVYAADIELIDSISCMMHIADRHINNIAGEYEPIKREEDYYNRALLNAGETELILLVDCESGAYKEIEADTLLSLASDTASFVTSGAYYARDFEIIGDSKYMIIYQRDKYEDIEIRFRRGADVDARLEELMKAE